MMKKTGWIVTLTAALLVAGLGSGCDAPADKGAAKGPTAKAPAKTPAAKVDDAAKEPKAEAPPAEPAPVDPPPTDTEGDQVPEDTAAPMDDDPTGDQPPEPEPEQPKPQPDNIRDPSLVPAGTPAGHVNAFKRLPVAKGDKAPVGGVGANGLHLDELEIGRGWHKSRCDLAGNTFTVGTDDRVNVCMRVIHPREKETLVIYWMRDGKQRQRSKVGVSNIHAYLTRGYLPITEDRKGSWTAVIKTEAGDVLGEVSFTINE